MKIPTLLLFLPILASAYNLDLENVMIHTAPSIDDQSNRSTDTFFGYSVLLYPRWRKAPSLEQSWMIVGAPKANYPKQGNSKTLQEPGVAYCCKLPGNCTPIKVTDLEDDKTVVNNAFSALIVKGHGWFGGAMSISEREDLLTVCAPRTILMIYNRNGLFFDSTMQGACYKGSVMSGSVSMENKRFSDYNFNTEHWVNPLNGFAVHYPRLKKNFEAPLPVIGSPTDNLAGTLHKMGQSDLATLWNNDVSAYLSLFGYAITSGYYFDKINLMVAAGAPEWQYVGRVAIIDYQHFSNQLVHVPIIEGTEIGEFFGASLATGDLNNDGLDDLIVGAPHWRNDNGRVYIFLGAGQGAFIDAKVMLEGYVEDAFYGYALTSGDLDSDGFDDLIVSAPWEESGTIYVYNGKGNLRDLTFNQFSQRITASEIGSDIRNFGFSFSEVLDVDGNGYPDVAVGAHASGHAMLLRSRPTMKTAVTLSTFPDILSRNATSFQIKLCVNHNRIDERQVWDALMDVTIDLDLKRVTTTYISIPIRQRQLVICFNRTIILEENISNYINDIEIVAQYEYPYRSALDTCKVIKVAGSLCPIEYKAQRISVQKTLSFDIGCGETRICKAFIIAKLEFPGKKDFTCVIGSKDLVLALIIENDGQPAYSTSVTFSIPKGIYLKSILPSCHEKEAKEGSRVTCDVGNPLKKTNGRERISLSLDISSFNDASFDGTKLNFSVDVNTLSSNGGITSAAISLELKANVSIALSGDTHNNTFYLGYDKKLPKILFQHNYKISRRGVTPISEVLLKMLVPYKLGDFQFLTIADNPRVSILGDFHKCSVSDVLVSSTKTKTEDSVLLDEAANPLGTGIIALMLRADEITHKTWANTTSQLQFKDDFHALLYTQLQIETIDTIYLDCLMANVTCGEIVCRTPFLNSTDDVRWLTVQLAADISEFTNHDEERKTDIHFVTEASVQVINNETPHVVPGTGSPFRVRTTFFRAPEAKNEYTIFGNIWNKFNSTSKDTTVQVIVGSTLLGLLIVGLIVVFLRHLGFFNRATKAKLDALLREQAEEANDDEEYS